MTESLWNIHSFRVRLSFRKFFLSVALHDVIKARIARMGTYGRRASHTSTRSKSKPIKRCTELARKGFVVLFLDLENQQ